MARKQYISGYRLSYEDGTVSNWRFMNDNDINIFLSILLKNGSRHTFHDEADKVYNWAANRALKVEQCRFEFDPETMTFTQQGGII